MFSLLIALTLSFSELKKEEVVQLPRNPVTHGIISSAYGVRVDPLSNKSRFHSGVDIASPIGAYIYAIGPGRVIFSGSYEGYGNLIVIKHRGEITSHYAHCWGRKVVVGDLVTEKSVVGYVGTSGRATGPHLHFEVRYRGNPINPRWILSLKESTHGES